jgi:rhodanese-related sulfurtransferase
MIRRLTPHEAVALIEAGGLDVVDVRGPSEWSSGHIPHARSVPLAEFTPDPRAKLTHDGVIFVCAKGIRSLTAARAAEALGFERLFNLEGGTLAWAGAGLPIVHD